MGPLFSKTRLRHRTRRTYHRHRRAVVEFVRLIRRCLSVVSTCQLSITMSKKEEAQQPILAQKQVPGRILISSSLRGYISYKIINTRSSVVIREILNLSSKNLVEIVAKNVIRVVTTSSNLQNILPLFNNNHH